MNDWNDIFRDAIAGSGLSVYMVAKRADVPVSVLQRFMESPASTRAGSKLKKKPKTLTLDTASKLAEVLGMELKRATTSRQPSPPSSKRKSN